MPISDNKPSADKLSAKVGAEPTELNLDVDDMPQGALPDLYLNYCIISKARAKEKTAGGIILTDSAKEATEYAAQIGRIEKVGEFFYNRGVFKEIPEDRRPGVGDYVCYKPYVSRRIVVDGVELSILKDDDIISKIDPSHHFQIHT